jgi:acyl dehydratase
METDTTQIPLTEPVRCVRLTTLPPMPAVFCKLLVLSFVRKPGLPPNARVPKGQLLLSGFVPDPEKISRYRQVCGFSHTPEDCTIPPSFLQTLFIGMLGRYVTSPFFPVNPMGLIQTGQSFEAIHPVGIYDTLDLTCTLKDMTRTSKGITTRFHLQIHTKNILVWQGISTYLTRDPVPGTTAKKPIKDRFLPPKLTFQVPADTGRRYARVSGDYNPHHLFHTTARLIGFQQAIAHGMWSLARTLAGLEQTMGFSRTFTVDAAFKLPIFMPATLTLGYDHIVAGPGRKRICFELRDAVDRLPHLKGNVDFLDRDR